MTSSFNYRKRAKQLIDFRGISNGCTDIDGLEFYDRKVQGVVDYRGKIFIFFEGKLKGADFPLGQKYALSHLCRTWYEPDAKIISHIKNFGWVLVFEHNVVDEDEDVIASDQYVINVYSSVCPEWCEPNSPKVIPQFELTEGRITVGNAIKQIEKWCRNNNIEID